MHQWKHTPITPLIEFRESTHTFQKFANTPMYKIRGFLDTLIMQLSIVPFTTNGTYGYDHG